MFYQMEVNQKELLLFWRSSGGLGMQKLLPKVEIKKWSLRLYCHQMKTNKLVDFRDKQWVSDSSLIGDKILIVTNNKEALPLFIRGKLGTSKFDCGDKI